MIKHLYNLIAIILTFVAFIPYVRSIYDGKTKPHVFSWVIWGLATVIVFAAQLSDGAGVGAWSIGLSGVITLAIAWLAYMRRADVHITSMDWVFFITALVSIPVWYFSRSALWAVVILTTIDTLGFGPTFRKAYVKPYEEALSLYVIISIRNLVSIFALEHYSWTTVLFPAVMSFFCGVFIVMVFIQRKRVKIDANLKGNA